MLGARRPKDAFCIPSLTFCLFLLLKTQHGIFGCITSGAGAGTEVTASTDAALTPGDSSSFNCNSKVEVDADDSNNARSFSSSSPASPTTVILPPSLHYSEDNGLNRSRTQSQPSQQLTPKSERTLVDSGKENDLAVYYTPSKVFKASDVADGKSML